MRNSIILPILLLSITLQSQNIHTKEIKVTYDNGFEIFNIITDKIDIKFKENLEYNWYNEYSGQSSSKGGSGGSLLHGKYSMFDENGRLKLQCFYKYGLQDSTSISWNDNGEISTKYVFKNGVQTYNKIRFDDGGWCEIYSIMGKPDYQVKRYTNRNILERVEKCIPTDPFIIEIVAYFPNLKTIMEHSFACGIFNYYGEYKEYFQNGSIKCSGNYDKKYKRGLKVGLWLVYNESSKQLDSIKYKLSEKILNPAGEKEIGSLVFSPELKDWIKTGHWYHITNSGEVIDEIKIATDSIKLVNDFVKTDIVSVPFSNTIKLIKTESGLLEVPVLLNDVLKINFIFDSGASEVSLSPDVALTLIRTGTVTDNDFLPDQTYMFADGSSAKSKRFLIKKLIIGNQTLTNIEASISKSIEAPMLIGQNAMNKLGTITIDYDNLILIIKSK